MARIVTSAYGSKYNMALAEPSNTQYEMRLVSLHTRHDTASYLPLSEQLPSFMNQFCSNVVESATYLGLNQLPFEAASLAEKWQVVKDRDLRIFMDTLRDGGFDHDEDGATECDPEAAEVIINVPTETSTFANVAYRNIYIWTDYSCTLAIFEDPTLKAPIVCARTLVITIED